MLDSRILYLAINLPRAEKRRKAVLEQAEQHGINLQIIEAIEGAQLDLERQNYGYDHRARRRCYTTDLLPNEIACVLSHRKALQAFLDSDADYGVIIEDDALLAPFFNEGMSELLEHLQGWDVVKLFTDDGKLHPLLPHCEQAVVQPVFPRKLPWVAAGYLYSRRAAEQLYAGLKRFWLPADAQIGKILIDNSIPTIGVTPGMITSSDPHNVNSFLDPEGIRKEFPPPRNFFQYIVYRMSVLLMGLGKTRMRHMMSRRLSRH